jgi:hypothetical protein
MVKNDRDFAVVIGINEYKCLKRLRGAEHDADQFRRWLLRADGGGLPAPNIFPNQPYIPVNGQPFPPLDYWLDAFGELARRSKYGQRRLGRRLYIFLAGHGSAGGVRDTRLFTYQSEENYPQELAVMAYADLFHHSAIFEQIVLFVDCCRDYQWECLAPYVAHKMKVDKQNASKVHRCYGFATGAYLKSHEHDAGGGRYRGVFARAVLEGLEGGGANAIHQITTRHLRKFLDSRVRMLRPQGSDQIPAYDAFDDFILVEGHAGPQTPVQINLTGPANRIVILYNLNPEEVVCEVPVTPGSLTASFSLAPGNYLFGVRRVPHGTGFERIAFKTVDDEVVHVDL